MLHGEFTSVLEARTLDELRGEVLRFTKWLGFDLMSAFVAVDRPVGGTEFYCIDNTPEGYRQTFENDDYSHRDPVLQHCKRFSTPIIWDQRTYLEGNLIEKWEKQAAFGYRTGVGMALHLPDGKHFVIGVDRDQALPVHPTELTRIVADLQLFAVHAQDSAMRLLVPPGQDSVALPQLTARELEALRWTMDGKTAWEVGAILGISERTAVLHVNNAMHKLGCASKHQAVIKALRLGLIR
jgi:DNA-binding CsgD family transcriptional regulator